MGMDIYGKSGNYFRANIWSWRAICHALDLAGFDVPNGWSFNDGDGLSSQTECNDLADLIQSFLKRWDGDVLTYEYGNIRVNKHGALVDSETPDSHSPYQTNRDHLEEFISFLRDCKGFEIH